MLKYFIKKVCKDGLLGKPRVVICVPSGVTEVEERAVNEAAIQAGAREAFLLEAIRMSSCLTCFLRTLWTKMKQIPFLRE